MEKLQPVIKQRFWILSGLVVVLSLLGWYLGSNNLSEFTKTEKGKIASATNGIPKGEIHPNEKWILDIKAVNSGRKTRSEMSAAELFAEQIEVMDWPPTIAPNFYGVGYREPAKSTLAQDKDLVRKYYRDTYKTNVIQPLEQIVVPYNGTTDRGIVKFNVGQLNYFESWSTYTPNWDEMWDMQEDCWLTRSLLQSIARVNREGKSTHYSDASIQEILTMKLLAGSKPNPGSYSGSTPSGIRSKNRDSGSGGVKIRKGPMGFGKKAQPKTKGGSAKKSQKDAETVPVRTTIANDEVTVFGVPLAGEPPPETESDETLGGSDSDEDDAPAIEEIEPRYVEEDPDLPFRTRGFILVLRMKLESLPLLLKELNQLEWPVEIRRVHWKLQKPNEDARFTDLIDFSEIREESKGTKKARGETDGTGSAGTSAPLGKTRGSGGGKSGKNSKSNDPNRIGIVNARQDRRSDIEVHIAGVMTIYRPPAEGSGIVVPKLKPKPKPTLKTETKPEQAKKTLIPVPKNDRNIPRKKNK